MHVSKEWLKALKIIDPTWRVECDESDGTYMVIKDVSVQVPLDNGRVGVFHGPRIVSVINHEPGDRDLEDLRARKAWGLKMNIVENPANELKYYADLNKMAKEKKRELALDMMTEGFMKAHKIATTATFVMPGEKKWPTTSPPPDSGSSTPPKQS